MSRTPVRPFRSSWDEIYREQTGRLADGAVLELAVKYRRTSERTPRHNH